MEAAHKENAQKMFLEVDSRNRPAIALYQAAGFHQKGMRKAYYSDGSDALIMQADL